MSLLLFEFGIILPVFYFCVVVDANALFEAMSSLVSRFNPFGKVTEVSPSHPKNASTPMLVNPSGKVTEVSPVHQENAYSPMLVNPSGKVTEVSPVHLLNAYSPMLVNPTEVSPLHP